MSLGCQAVRFNPSIANHKMVSIAYLGLLKLSLHVTVHGAEHGKTDSRAKNLGVPVIKASTGASTRQVNSRLAFAHQLQHQIMTLRVMPDAPKKEPPGWAALL